MEIRLIALDLDGTLLNSCKEITDRTINALAYAAAKGIYIVPSSGRSLSGIPNVVADLPFVQYALTLNGAVVINIRTKEIIHEYAYTYDEALSLWDFIQKYDAIPDCSLNGELYMEHRTFLKLPNYTDDPKRILLMKQTRKEADNIRTMLQNGNAKSEKMNLFFANPDERKMARQELEQFPFVEVSSSLNMNLELNRKGGNKGNGLKALAAYLGIEVNEVMACGDSDNDISMIEAAGFSVAMANATPEILNIADVVTLSNDEDGVAHAIETWILN
jgi:Cof subfamily protein (haloacid dehalogenase superfamily)